MNLEKQYSNTVMVESPVEFVLIGPVFDDLRVLIKSNNAGIDLIGYSQDEYQNIFSKTQSIFQSSLIPQKVYSKNFDQIRFTHVDNSEQSSIEHFRPSVYKFVWRGVNSKKHNELINNIFNESLPDLIIAFKNHDLGRIEWKLAILISICSDSILHREKNRIYSILIACFYAIAFIICMFVLIDRVMSLFK